MSKGYRVKINGVYEDDHASEVKRVWPFADMKGKRTLTKEPTGIFGWEEIGFPIMSPICIGSCNRPVKEFDEGYITSYEHFICTNCISEFKVEDAS